MSRIEAPRVGRHPGKMPGGVKLADCMQELISVFGQMIVSTADRESRAFLGMSGIAASMDFYDPNAREPYVTSWYLRDAASEAMVKALSSGHLPTWTDYDGSFVELDHETLFGPNKWNSSYTVQTGIYVALNVAYGRDGPTRAECDGATLWVREEDWPRIRGELIANREREVGTVLPSDMTQLMLGSSATLISEAPAAADTAAPLALWSLYEAVAWMGTHDLAFVERQQPHHFPGTTAKNYGAVAWKRLEQSLVHRATAGSGMMTADAARIKLLAACQTGSVRATGIPADKGDRRDVPAYDFIGVQLWERRGGSLHRVVAGINEPARWYDLRFRADDVRAPVAKPTPQTTVAEIKNKPTVSGSDLRGWVRARNVEGWDQDQIVKGAASAFPDNVVPGRPTIRKLDADVRVQLELPARTRGRNKKGG